MSCSHTKAGWHFRNIKLPRGRYRLFIHDCNKYNAHQEGYEAGFKRWQTVYSKHPKLFKILERL